VESARAAVAAPAEEDPDTPDTMPGAEGTDAPKRRAGSDSTTFMQITTGVCRVLESQLDQLEGVWADAVGRGATYLVDQYNFTEDPLDTGK
jgi:hypothetical protein